VELDGAAEAESQRLLHRDVQEAELLELLRALERPDVERPQPCGGDELRDLLLGFVVVAGDEDVRAAGLRACPRRASGERSY
jgi:hypothetical protein